MLLLNFNNFFFKFYFNYKKIVTFKLKIDLNHDQTNAVHAKQNVNLNFCFAVDDDINDDNILFVIKNVYNENY